jgi:predicted ATP-binding protein involved in virulence
MYLKELTLTNVRAITSLQLTLPSESSESKLTMLLGENGCGKSTVLKAIALLLSGSDALIDLLPDPESWIKKGHSTCLISGVFSLVDGSEVSASLAILRGDTVRKVLLRNRESLSMIDREIERSADRIFVAGYGVARRPPPTDKYATYRDKRFSSERVRAVGSMFSSDFSLISVEQWAFDLDYRQGTVGRKLVTNTLNKLLPGIHLEKFDKKRGSLIFRTPDGLISYDDLSDGYRSMAAWCGDLLYRLTSQFEFLKEPQLVTGILLVDEIDLHLHPIWQRQLIQFLSRAFPNLHIIATTHSVFAAQQCKEGELFVMQRATPDQAPAILPFQGDPEKFLLHQIMLSPMFGIPSLDSVEVETMRNEYAHLAKTPRSERSNDDESRLRKLKSELSDLPDWDLVPRYEREQTVLIKEIRTLLRDQGAPTRVSPKKVQERIKAMNAKK